MADATRAETQTTRIAEIPLSRDFGWTWLLALLAAGGLVGLFGYTVVALLVQGIGVWGTNIPFVWGFDLINYTWWIGIANGASLVAAILVYRKHSARTAVNRFAEGAALFAVICAGIFPIIHLGRPWLFYWVFPYPATFQVWPQFRSTLTWDFWAISTHAIVTTLLWYIGLIPDLATLRERARGAVSKRVFGLFALGWRGSVRHWALHQAAYRLVAILVLPLILVMQSTVAFEFAVTLVPDWHETRQPVHFIVTGVATGLATVLMVAVLLRRFLGLDRYIDDSDMDFLGKVLLANALLIAYVYLDEVFMAYLADDFTREAVVGRMVGEYAWLFWSAVVLTALVPQALWFRAVRVSFVGPLAIAVAVNAGVWLDRFSIIVAGLRKDYLPAMWRSYAPTFPEINLLIGSLGLFFVLLLLFVRFLPVISMFETRHDEHEEKTS